MILLIPNGEPGLSIMETAFYQCVEKETIDRWEKKVYDKNILRHIEKRIGKEENT